jgi:hypothetical protein
LAAGPKEAPAASSSARRKAGGDFYHSGGKHWTSQADPEWLTLRAFVTGQAN